MKDPAFLFYSSDFLSGIQDLTMEERGQYITLLCIQHQKGHLTEKMIRLSCGNAAADVLAKFDKDEDGNFYSKRLEVEIEKRREHANKQRQRALDGWKKRKQDNDATANATALPLENENENEIDNKDKKRNKAFTPDFETLPEWMKAPLGLWLEYKTQKGEKYVKAGWTALISKISNEYANEKELSAAVHNSMANGWKGIFKAKHEPQSNPMTDDLSNMDYSKPF